MQVKNERVKERKERERVYDAERIKERVGQW